MLEQYEDIVLTKKRLTLSLHFFARVVNDVNNQGETTEINSAFQLTTEGVSHKFTLISPNVSGARELIAGTDYVYDGINGIVLTIDGASLCQGTHRLQVELRYGTNTLSVYGLDITVPCGKLEDGTQEYESNIYAVETYGDGVVEIDAVPTEDSENAVSSGGTYTALVGKADGSVYQVGESGDPAVSNVAKVYGHSVELSNSAVAIGRNSVAEGEGKTASGVYSHAEGEGTTASGAGSHAEGNGTTSNGDSSHAEGLGTTASGDGSHAEGNGTTASGDYSHAEGSGTTTNGDGSHAEGNGTTASGDYSHAEGNGTTSNGDSSHAEGLGTTASGDYQHVSGKYNVEDTEGDYAFIVGNGSDNEHRSNAFAIDWSGNLVLFNNGTPVVLTPSALAAVIAGANI